MVTNNSHIIKAIQNHIDTGIPIDSYDLTPQDKQRIEAVFHLYKVWKDNPFVDTRSFLMYVHNRRSQDVAGDLYCFDYIKNAVQQTLTISRSDAEYIHDQYTRKLLQAGDATGDASLWDKGLKHLEKSKKIGQDEAQDEVAKHTATLPYAFTRDIKQIDPERESMSVEHKSKILAKYGGSPDANAERIQEKKQKLLGLSVFEGEDSPAENIMEEDSEQ